MDFPSRRYPAHLIDVMHVADRGRVVIRPVLPQDRDLFCAFVDNLSPASRSSRFMAGLGARSPLLLDALTNVDHERHLALLAVVAERRREVVVAEARCANDAIERHRWEFAVCVADAWQGRGLGRNILLRALSGAALPESATVEGDTQATNVGMLALGRRLGFSIENLSREVRLRLRPKELVGRELA